MEKENKLEKFSRNKNDSNIFLFIGVLAEVFLPSSCSAFPAMITSVSATYIRQPLVEMRNVYKTSQKEMPLYAVKNTARLMIGATAVSALRYLF